MGECACCGKVAKDLYICEDCMEPVCDDCLVGVLPPPHPMIDYNLCNTCYKSSTKQ